MKKSKMLTKIEICHKTNLNISTEIVSISAYGVVGFRGVSNAISISVYDLSLSPFANNLPPFIR